MVHGGQNSTVGIALFVTAVSTFAAFSFWRETQHLRKKLADTDANRGKLQARLQSTNSSILKDERTAELPSIVAGDQSSVSSDSTQKTSNKTALSTASSSGGDDIPASSVYIGKDDETFFTLREIGRVDSPFPLRNSCPRIGGGKHIRSRVVLANHVPPKVLDGITQFSHVWILFQFHLPTPTPSLPPSSPVSRLGALATRTAHRPNPIGLSVAQVESIQDRVLHGGETQVAIVLLGLDLVDGTPIYDIKPYLVSDCVVPKELLSGAITSKSPLQLPDWARTTPVAASLSWTTEAQQQLRDNMAEVGSWYRKNVEGAQRAIVEVLEQDPRAMSHNGLFYTSFGGLRIAVQPNKDRSATIISAIPDPGDIRASRNSYAYNMALRRRAEREAGKRLAWANNVREGMTKNVLELRSGKYYEMKVPPAMRRRRLDDPSLPSLGRSSRSVQQDERAKNRSWNASSSSRASAVSAKPPSSSSTQRRGSVSSQASAKSTKTTSSTSSRTSQSSSSSKRSPSRRSSDRSSDSTPSRMSEISFRIPDSTTSCTPSGEGRKSGRDPTLTTLSSSPSSSLSARKLPPTETKSSSSQSLGARRRPSTHRSSEPLQVVSKDRSESTKRRNTEDREGSIESQQEREINEGD